MSNKSPNCPHDNKGIILNIKTLLVRLHCIWPLFGNLRESWQEWWSQGNLASNREKISHSLRWCERHRTLRGFLTLFCALYMMTLTWGEGSKTNTHVNGTVNLYNSLGNNCSNRQQEPEKVFLPLDSNSSSWICDKKKLTELWKKTYVQICSLQ